MQKTQRQFQQLEEKIAILTKQKVTLESSLVSPEIYTNNNKFSQTESDYKIASDQLEKANAEYEVVFEKIMALAAKS
ncbi:MAG: ABC transporter C-terminal domain-containing protein [Chitinophagaceae bacterium]